MNDLISSSYRWSWVMDRLESEEKTGAAAATLRKKPADTKASRGHALMASKSAAVLSPTKVSPTSEVGRLGRGPCASRFPLGQRHSLDTTRSFSSPPRAQPFVMKRFQGIGPRVYTGRRAADEATVPGPAAMGPEAEAALVVEGAGAPASE